MGRPDPGGRVAVTQGVLLATPLVIPPEYYRPRSDNEHSIQGRRTAQKPTRKDTMRIQSAICSAFGLALLALCTGCSHMHRVVNTGDGMLYAVTVQSGDRKCGHGLLPATCYKTYSGSMKISRNPPPVVSWKMTEHGDFVSQAVKLDYNLGWREVIFELDGKTVKGSLRKR